MYQSARDPSAPLVTALRLVMARAKSRVERLGEIMVIARLSESFTV